MRRLDDGTASLALAGARILVTGASSGIGQASASVLAELGASVVLTGRDAERLEAARSSMAGGGHAVEPFDLCDVRRIPAWMKQVAETHGALDGLVHCAGLQKYMPLRFLDVDAVEQMFRINVFAAMALLQGLRQKQVRQVTASAVFIASVMGLVGEALQAPYGATKGALMAMVRSAALELASEGIRVNVVAPAVVRTPMSEQMFAKLDEHQMRAIEGAHPLGLGEPRDVATAVAFLVGPGSRWITGSTLVADGGYLSR